MQSKESAAGTFRRDGRPEHRSKEKDSKSRQPGKTLLPVEVSRQLPKGPSDHSKQRPVLVELYGTISTIKQGFGFIQPIVEEDQIYFGGRELSLTMRMGDRVGFVTRESPRGLAAENVRVLSEQLDSVVASAKGSVSRNPDRHRSNYGMITIELPSLDARSLSVLEAAGAKELHFSPADVVANTVPRGHRLEKGDYVEFSVHRVVGSNLFVAKNVGLVQLKRERAVALQIQRMLDAGVQREHGVVSALKKGEYGFIKPLDRKDEIYFRLGDSGAADAASDEKLTEGDEVEFFVITECVKGKMSDRAIHVRPLPKGTVRFEIVLATQQGAVVIAESGARAEESPGIARLSRPVELPASDPALAGAGAAVGGVVSARHGGGATGPLSPSPAEGGEAAAAAAAVSSVHTVELWQRCLPDELVCRVGDLLQLDVHYYRPEKLFFARNVRVVQLRRLGRERGAVVALKENGFGFIHSGLRNCDAYFKSSQVLGPDGLPLGDGALRVGSAVSFEISPDEGAGGKLRAKRVLLENGARAPGALDAQYLIRQGLEGVVVRNSTKKDSAGLIRIAPALQQELEKTPFFDPELVVALEDFQKNAELQGATLHCLPLAAVRSIVQVIEQRFEGIAHESSPASAHDANLGYNLKISKLSAEKYAQWLSSHSTGASTAKGKADNSATVPFYKDDYVSPEFGQLANDLRVRFDLYWDPSRGKRVARQVRLTDEPALDASGAPLGEQRGVVDVLVEKSEREKFGFIRCIPSDEKLFWHLSSAAATGLPTPADGQASQAPLMLGSEVAFIIRLRGGLRCATAIRTLPAGSLVAEEQLQGLCQAVVVSVAPPLLVLLNVDAAPELRQKFLNLRVVAEANGGKADATEAWSKQALPHKAPGEGSTEGENGDGCEAPSAADGEPGAGESETAPAVDDAVESAAERAPARENFKPKHFPPLPRTSIPFQVASGLDLQLQAGDVVQCQVAVKWAVQRSPVHAVVSAVEPLKAARCKGRIVKAKFRAKALTTSAFVDADTLACYSLGTTDLTELNDPSSEAGVLVCCASELQAADEHSRDLPQTGDEVEFWTVPALFPNYALFPRLLPRTKDNGIQFSKRPVAASAAGASGGDASKSKASPLVLITMAEGPPNDAASGFAAGWRTALASSAAECKGAGDESHAAGAVVGAGVEAALPSQLPWASLLAHLH